MQVSSLKNIEQNGHRKYQVYNFLDVSRVKYGNKFKYNRLPEVFIWLLAREVSANQVFETQQGLNIVCPYGALIL